MTKNTTKNKKSHYGTDSLIGTQSSTMFYSSVKSVDTTVIFTWTWGINKSKYKLSIQVFI